MSNINELLDVVDTPSVEETKNKREHLIQLIQQGTTTFGGKTPWTVEKINKASSKVIDKLYDASKTQKKKRDIMSQIIGVKDIDALLRDINENYLLKNGITDLLPQSMVNLHSPVVYLGACFYSIVGDKILSGLSLLSTGIRHLDWVKIIKTAREWQEDKKEVEPEFCPNDDDDDTLIEGG